MGKIRRLEVEKWLAKNRAKRWTELFFFFYSFTWIAWCLCILIPFKLYDNLDEWGYLAVGVFAAAPCFLLPIYFQDEADAKKPIANRYWVKANVWIAIFSFVGNYLWTHYFYSLLGASYSFPAHKLNEVCLFAYCQTKACLHGNTSFQNDYGFMPIPGSVVAGSNHAVFYDSCLFLFLSFHLQFAHSSCPGSLQTFWQEGGISL